MVLLFTGCTFAKYAKVRVRVVDEQTQAGIPKARLRTFYTKPMFDTTYQRKDREKTDGNGCATLSIATNWSQRMILGWTHGIIPRISVEATGYLSREAYLSRESHDRNDPVIVPMRKLDEGATRTESADR
jgi:hypothetical protein